MRKLFVCLMSLVVAGACSLLLLACKRETVDSSTNAPSDSTTVAGQTVTSTMNPPLPTEIDDPSSRPTPAGPVQEVHLIEYALHMPETMPAGKITFNVENGGKEDHGFEIEGNGIEQKTNILKAGDSAALDVELIPGTYTAYCPVKGHRARGMQKTITVK